jgi:hypothetical protein
MGRLDDRTAIVEPNIDTLELMEHWIIERESIREAKEQRLPPPWTNDPVLAKHRFGNVLRADDHISQFLLQWYQSRLAPYASHSMQDRLDTAGVLCFLGRLILWPDTLDELPEDIFNVGEVERALYDRAQRKQRVLGDRTPAPEHIKIQHAVQRLTQYMQRPPRINATSVRIVHYELQSHPAVGAFLAGQMASDLMLLFPAGWQDMHTWAPLGPASVRGLRMLFESATISQTKTRRNEYIQKFRDCVVARGKVSRELTNRMTLMDWHNVLCEASRYVFLVNRGEGTFKNMDPITELLGEE